MPRAHRGDWLLGIDDIPWFSRELLDLILLAEVRFVHRVLMSDLAFIVGKLGCTTKLVLVWFSGMDLPEN
jgi:hypothetical protein